jgi:hypothetical protein
MTRTQQQALYGFLQFALLVVCGTVLLVVIMAYNAEDFNLNEWVAAGEWLTAMLAGGGTYHLIQSYLKK